ncbi:unnamed protein product [Diplocarpon coronariae]
MYRCQDPPPPDPPHLGVGLYVALLDPTRQRTSHTAHRTPHIELDLGISPLACLRPKPDESAHALPRGEFESGWVMLAARTASRSRTGHGNRAARLPYAGPPYGPTPNTSGPLARSGWDRRRLGILFGWRPSTAIVGLAPALPANIGIRPGVGAWKSHGLADVCLWVEAERRGGVGGEELELEAERRGEEELEGEELELEAERRGEELELEAERRGEEELEGEELERRSRTWRQRGEEERGEEERGEEETGEKERGEERSGGLGLDAPPRDLRTSPAKPDSDSETCRIPGPFVTGISCRPHTVIALGRERGLLCRGHSSTYPSGHRALRLGQPLTVGRSRAAISLGVRVHFGRPSTFAASSSSTSEQKDVEDGNETSSADTKTACPSVH